MEGTEEDALNAHIQSMKETFSTKKVAGKMARNMKRRKTKLKMLQRDEHAGVTALKESVIFILHRSIVHSAVKRWKLVTEALREEERQAKKKQLMSAVRLVLLGTKNQTKVRRSAEELDTLVKWASTVQSETFEHVNPSELRDTMRHVIFRTYQDGEWLFAQGDSGEYFYIVFSGTIALCAGAPKSSLHALKTDRMTVLGKATSQNGYLGNFVYSMSAGESFGEVAIHTDNGVRTASAAAMGCCELMLIPRDVYMRNMYKSRADAFQATQKLALLPDFPYFADWQRGKLVQLGSYMTHRSIPYGTKLQVAGLRPTACYFIAAGSARVSRYIEQPIVPMEMSMRLRRDLVTQKKTRKYTVEVDTLSKYDAIGLEALIYPNRVSDYAITASSSRLDVFQIDRKHAHYFHAIARHADFKKNFFDCFQTYQKLWATRFEKNKASVLMTMNKDPTKTVETAVERARPVQPPQEPSSISIATTPTLASMLSSWGKCTQCQVQPSIRKVQHRRMRKFSEATINQALGRQHAAGGGLCWHPSKGLTQSTVRPMEPTRPATSTMTSQHHDTDVVQARVNRYRAIPTKLRQQRLARQHCRDLQRQHYDRTIDSTSTFTHNFFSSH